MLGVTREGKAGEVEGNSARNAWGCPTQPLHSVGVVHVKALTRVLAMPDSIRSQGCPELQEAHLLDFLAPDLV